MSKPTLYVAASDGKLTLGQVQKILAELALEEKLKRKDERRYEQQKVMMIKRKLYDLYLKEMQKQGHI